MLNYAVEKTEEIPLSILVPLIAQPILRINKKIDFEKWDFEHIFDDPYFFKTHYVREEEKNDRE